MDVNNVGMDNVTGNQWMLADALEKTMGATGGHVKFSGSASMILYLCKTKDRVEIYTVTM